MADPARVILWDRSARPRLLPFAWRLGSGLLTRATSIGARSPQTAYNQLLAHCDRYEVKEVQIWSHMSRGRIHWGDTMLDLRTLAHIVGPERVWWLRGCQFMDPKLRRDAQGKATIEDYWHVRDAMDVLRPSLLVGHTQVTNLPNPIEQRGLVALFPHEAPAWGRGYDGAACLTTTMRVPLQKARRWVRHQPSLPT